MAGPGLEIDIYVVLFRDSTGSRVTISFGLPSTAMVDFLDSIVHRFTQAEFPAWRIESHGRSV